MKRPFTLSIICIALLSGYVAKATTHIITQEGTSFAPNLLEVQVGDTVMWQWTGGSHTTTSLVIPAGAAAWDEPLDSDNTTFSYPVEVEGDYGYKCTPHFSMGMVGGFQATAATVSVAPVAQIALDFTVAMIGNHQLQLDIANPQSAQTTVRMFDLNGRVMDVLMSERLVAGNHRLVFDMKEHPAGIYFVRMEQGEQVITRKISIRG